MCIVTVTTHNTRMPKHADNIDTAFTPVLLTGAGSDKSQTYADLSSLILHLPPLATLLCSQGSGAVCRTQKELTTLFSLKVTKPGSITALADLNHCRPPVLQRGNFKRCYFNRYCVLGLDMTPSRYSVQYLSLSKNGLHMGHGA